MILECPLSLRLRGAANNGSWMPGGSPVSGFHERLNPTSPQVSEIARSSFGALAHVVPTSGDVGFLNAGASCPGSIEGV